MGAENLTLAVTDAGPLLHLNEINLLSVLELFESILVPHSVWEETVGKKRFSNDILNKKIFAIQSQIEVQLVNQFVNQYQFQSLHLGEIECLYICHNQNIQLFLTDDLAAREAAKKINITPIGSVGIIMRAYREKQLSQKDTIQFLLNLNEKSSLFVTSAIIEQAIDLVKKH